jgi:hypothetical protein
MLNHPYKRRDIKLVAPGFNQHVGDAQERQHAEASYPDHERDAMYESHAKPKPVIVTHKRRWSVLKSSTSAP